MKPMPYTTHSRRRTLLIATIAAALAAAPAFASPQTAPDTNPQSKGLTVVHVQPAADVILITVMTEKQYGSGYNITNGTERDIAAHGSLSANYTIRGGANTFSAHDATSNVDVISALPGDSRDKGPAPTRITASKNIVNGAANSGSGVIGHQVPFVGENGVTNATADLVSYPARYAHGLELAGNTYLSIGNGATANGGTTNK